ncbi:hypothetical protein [Lacisediminihabitans changchengi]|uniref:Uncharacterized protein n=1 Tax=Lacisediminihabitans changchengi TaxID=2787634 RepID=A0A934W2V4_9MICO|nr:hypothetical protein [Lacisediminihabitans changchengi]MBK4346579.1 hypothetical protein [Lacisediminihabitans changchengi]
MRIVRAIVILSVAGLAVTGCTTNPIRPSLSPTATQPADAGQPSASPTTVSGTPALDSLVITPEGLGPLRIGMAAADSPLLKFMPQYCQLEGDGDGFSAGDAAADRWVANYAGDNTFDVEVVDGKVAGIAPASPSLRTAKGIHLGSTAAELRAAYPGLQPGVTGSLSHTELLQSGNRMVSFEILAPNTDYEPELSDRVVYIVIRAASGNPPSTVYATDGGIGSCL